MVVKVKKNPLKKVDMLKKTRNVKSTLDEDKEIQDILKELYLIKRNLTISRLKYCTKGI